MEYSHDYYLFYVWPDCSVLLDFETTCPTVKQCTVLSPAVRQKRYKDKDADMFGIWLSSSVIN